MTLITWWTFDDGTATDQSTGGNNGTITGSPASVSGKIGSALSFDGSTNYIIGSQTINISIATVAVWVKTTTTPPSQGGYLCGFENGTGSGVTDKAFSLNSSGFPVFNVYDGSAVTVTGTVAVNDGTWHHLCGVVDGTNIILYIDGTANGSAAASGSYQGFSVPNIIMGANFYPQAIAAAMDDFRIYDTALSSGAVATLFAGSGSTAWNISANFVGAGLLTAAVVQPTSAHFAGAGALTATVKQSLAISAHFAGAGSLTATVGNPNLILWWTFDDGTATDQSGVGDNGTLSGSPPSVPGIFGNALSFDGSGSYVGSANTLLLSLVTVSLWVKTTMVPTGTGAWICGFANGYNNSTNDKSIVLNSSGQPTWNIYSNSNGSVNLVGTSPINDGQWHHIAGVVDGTNSILYVDGAAVASSAAADSFLGFSVPDVFIGGNAAANYYPAPFVGLVDDFRIYNTGLSNSQVHALYWIYARNISAAPMAAVGLLTARVNGPGLPLLGIVGPQPAEMPSFTQFLGRSPELITDYVDGQPNWSGMVGLLTFIISYYSALPQRLYLSLPMLPHDNGASTFATGLTGAYDTYFLDMANQLVAAGRANTIIRLGWEFNGNWYPWSTYIDPTNWVPYWQRIVTVMRGASGQQFKFDWCFNMDSSEGDPSVFYPGNSYVDYISCDIYDRYYDPTYADPTYRWNNLFVGATYGLSWMATFAATQGKPMGIGEWGVAIFSDGSGAGDDPIFINKFADWFSTHNFAYQCYFSVAALDSSGFDTLLQHFPNSAAAYVGNFGFRSPLFNLMNGSGNLTAAVVQPGSTAWNISANFAGAGNLTAAGPLITWWTFDDGTATDQSGIGDNGTLVGSPASVAGHSGNALSFNGSNYVLGADLINTSLVTVSAWVKTSTTPGSPGSFICGFANGYNSGVADKYFAITNTGTVQWWVYSPTIGLNVTLTSSASIADGAWHLLCGVVDGTNSILYIDGTAVASAAGPDSYTGYTVPNLVIAGPVSNTYFSAPFTGVVDDFRVYNKPLSAGAVAALFAASTAWNISAAFSGAGALTAALREAETIAAHLAGAGALTGAITQQVHIAANFSGAGSLVASTTAGTVTAHFAGTGALTGTVTIATPAASTLSASGALTASVTLTAAATANLAGAGALTAAVTRFVPIAATLTGAGAFAAAVTSADAISAAFAGAGTVSVQVTQALAISAVFAGASTLQASTTAGTVTARFAGAGALAAVATEVMVASSGPMAGAGALTAAASVGVAAAAAPMAAAGSLAASVTEGMAIASPLAAAGSLTANVNVLRYAAAAFQGAGAMTAAAAQNAAIAATWAGTGSAAPVQLTLNAMISAQFSGAGAIAVQTTQVWQISETWAGIGSLSASAIHVPAFVDTTTAKIVTGSTSAAIIGGHARLTLHANLEFYVGDTWEFEFLCVNIDGTPMDLTGASFLWKLGTQSHVPVLTYTTLAFVPSEVTIGTVNLDIPASVTANIPRGNYVDLFQVTTALGVVSTQATGPIQAV